MDAKLLKKAGMTTEKAQELLKKYGPNRIEYRSKSAFMILLEQVLNPLTILLALACIISFATGSAIDGNIILVIVALNTFIGFVQENRSNIIFKKLSALISAKVLAWRDGHKVEIDKLDVVPGDMIFLQLGAIVPADCFIIDNNNAVIDESTLTGESVPVHKINNPKENPALKDGIIYAGTYVRSGNVVAKVFATGEASKFGKIARLTLNVNHLTEYEKNLRKLSRDIILIALFSLGLIFLLHNIFHPKEDFVTLLLFTVSISITVIPEALPAIATITLSNSALKLGKKGVVIKQLASIESLGNVDMICTDKTGTLTENKLRVIKTQVNPKFKKEFYEYCRLSAAESTDPFDQALQEMLQISNFEVSKKMPEFQDIPFDPFKKYSARQFKDFRLIKGAPELLLKQSHYTEVALSKLEAEDNKGYRVLALAMEKGIRTKKIEYIATLYFYDPIKTDVTQTLHDAEFHGIGIKVITGDSFGISRFVGKEVGIIHSDEEIIEASELIYEEPRILEQQVLKYKVFCRADPIQKYKIIEALQTNHTIAYLGDGINDAPSLQLADVGIVVNNATDIAKASADLVLLRKNLSALVAGIIEGRRAFENIEKYIIHTLTGNLGNFLTIGILSLFLSYLPMLPIQILISNLIIDLASLTFAFDRVDNKAIKRPLHRDFSQMLRFAFVLGAVTSILDLVFFLWARQFTPGQVQTLWFVTSGLAELFFIFSVRTHDLFIRSKVRLPMVAIVIISSFILLLLALFGIPGESAATLSLDFLPAIAIITAIYFMCTELVKLRAVKHFNV